VSAVAVVGVGSAAAALAANARAAGLTVSFEPMEPAHAQASGSVGGIGRLLVAPEGVPREDLVQVVLTFTARDVPVWLDVTSWPDLGEFLPRERIGDREGVVLWRARESHRLSRVIDVIVAGAAIAGLLPLWLVLSVLVKLSSPGPVFYQAKVVGQDGRSFTWYKFRTMRVAEDDEPQRRERFADFVRGGEAPTKIIDESRVTAVGEMLRRHSLDELPQLLSVWRGDMTLIGPRPCLVYEYELLRPWHRRRFAVRPGLTGLWQVRGRGRVHADDMACMDICYALGRTWCSDLRVLWETARVMVSGRGAA